MINLITNLTSKIKNNLNRSTKVKSYSRKRKEYKGGLKYTGSLVVWNSKTNQYDYY